MRNFLSRGKKLFVDPQESILSAAFIIMLMIVAAQVLGFVKERVILHYFAPEQYSLYLAAFRLPDLVFEVLAYGAFSSAFIPVFTKALTKEGEAWDIAQRIVNIGLVIFIPLAIVFSFGAETFYRIVAPGYTDAETAQIASIARVLFAAQGIFIVSYVLTGVLESLRRFLVPALAPLLYNLGIILGTVLFSSSLGLYGPAIGVLLGAFAHLMVQMPLAVRLGFRLGVKIRPTDGVRKVGRLALPRMVELSSLQVLKTVELFFASIISTGSLTYLYLANKLYTFPITLFGVSLAKAALPTLTRQADDDKKFAKTFLSTLYQMLFLVLPIATLLIVFRVPLVRLLFGTSIFDWEATVQTGLVLSAFAVGIPFQAVLTLTTRAFYAKHDTRIPVIFSIIDVVLTIAIEIPLVIILHLPVWSLAVANTVALSIQSSILYVILSKRVNDGVLFSVKPILKSVIASVTSGIVMFSILKFFDRSVWVKRLSFMKQIDLSRNLDFERFVLDTRYTSNLFILVAVTSLIGGIVYFLVSYILKSDELTSLIDIVRKRAFPTLSKKEMEPLTTPSSDSGQV